MDSLIYRQAAIDALMEKDKKLRNINWYYKPYAEGKCKGIDEALSIISNLPSAEPERPPGHWKKISPAGIYECDLCGKNVMTRDIDAYDFCHGCGSPMEVEHD